MPVCYFNKDYDVKYNCEYEMDKDGVIVTVNYNIVEEVEIINGFRTIGPKTNYKSRDILIVDYEKRKNVLLKNAFYFGINSIFGSPAGSSYTKFKSYVYLENNDLNKICNLPITPKTKNIKIYSRSVNQLIGCPSLMLEENDEFNLIKLKKENDNQKIEIGCHYIKAIKVSDTWWKTHKYKEYIHIDFNGYVEIELMKKFSYDLISSFVHEFQIYMQLLIPDKFEINKMSIMIDNEYYDIHLPLKEMKFSKGAAIPSVECDLLKYIKKCYDLIPYRNSKTEIRNIPYIIMNTSRGLEDNFLMCYRFIECYYKKQNIPNIKKTFMTYSFKEHYLKKHPELTDEEIENFVCEIVSLRNHYVHAGYYIKNENLRVAYNGNDKKSITVNPVDVNWIYVRTKMLYEISLDIIFKSILGFEEYRFSRHF